MQRKDKTFFNIGTPWFEPGDTQGLQDLGLETCRDSLAWV